MIELGMRDGRFDRYVGNIFSKHQINFDGSAAKLPDSYKLRTDLYPYLVDPSKPVQKTETHQL